jgi:DNA helicase-2/ATP-dependent DNA helicase PcrA
MVDFNEFQQKVIELSSGKHACMASAGSGKTEVLTERLQRAIAKGVDPESILCITFTNRAALSMTERIKQKLSQESLKKVFVGNTHALALKLLHETRYFPYTYTLCTTDVSNDLWRVSEKTISEKLKSLIPNKFEVAMENISRDSYGWRKRLKHHLEGTVTNEDLQPLRDYLLKSSTKEILEKLEHVDLKLTVSACLGTKVDLIPDIASVKSNNHNKIGFYQIYSVLKPLLEKVIKDVNSETEYIQFVKEKLMVTHSDKGLSKFDCDLSLMICVTILIATEYESLKNQLVLYDFDDALCSSLKLESRNFSWIQVDECQDLSPIQWLIIKHHMVKDAHLLMLGDINQSIYRFLGASIETTRKELGGSNYELPINYRSPKNLVDFFKKYMAYNFPSRFQSEVESFKDDNPSALIYVHRQSEKKHNDRLLQHAIKLVKDGRNTAFLCPTNAIVDNTSEFLSFNNVEHFKISQNDILTSKHALDFFSFIRSLHDENDHLAWARLLWNFGSVASLKNSDGDTVFAPQLQSLHIVSQLVQLGGTLSDLVSGSNIFDNLFAKMNDAFENGYTFFDTETTGLNASDNIIQIAGVSVIQGKFSGELDLYCQSDKPVGETEKIHKISDDFLITNGSDFALQSKKFIEFTDGRAVIAHNLEFDESMMESNLSRSGSDDLDRFCHLPKLCSLKLARRLYPQLKSHKLGDLLSEFEIEGVNSHNALDDVRAGANFIEFVRKDVFDRSLKLDEFIDSYESTFNRFRNKIGDLLFEATKLGEEIDLEVLFDFYFDFVRERKLHDIDKDKLSELRYKLIRWSKRHFESKKIKDYLSKIIPFVQTLKESDLITENDKLVVSTIHKSKGLEFDYVILPSVVDAKYPAYPIQMMKESKEKEMLIQEQRRLLYVGMTRAKQQLVIGSYDNFYTPYGTLKYTQPCSFMYDMFEQMKNC